MEAQVHFKSTVVANFDLTTSQIKTILTQLRYSATFDQPYQRFTNTNSSSTNPKTPAILGQNAITLVL